MEPRARPRSFSTTVPPTTETVTASEPTALLSSLAGPAPASLDEARRRAAGCTRCDLYRRGTQTVFGEGPDDAPLMLVGEQPGDQEDLAGRPFVGPSGRVLRQAMEEAGLDIGAAYVTNAVKHFKNEPRGKRRLHKKPNAGEIEACRWWLDLERTFVRPKVVVALGATALQGLLGSPVAVSRMRGRPETLGDGSLLLATVHPSYLLRIRTGGGYEQEYARFVGDLRQAGLLVSQGLPGEPPTARV